MVRMEESKRPGTSKSITVQERKRIARVGELFNKEDAASADFVNDIIRKMDSKVSFEKNSHQQEIDSLKRKTCLEDGSKTEKSFNLQNLRPPRRFQPERSHPLMAKCQKNLKYIKHNRKIPKQRAHMYPKATPKSQSVRKRKLTSSEENVHPIIEGFKELVSDRKARKSALQNYKIPKRPSIRKKDADKTLISNARDTSRHSKRFESELEWEKNVTEADKEEHQSELDNESFSYKSCTRNSSRKRRIETDSECEDVNASKKTNNKVSSVSDSDTAEQENVGGPVMSKRYYRKSSRLKKHIELESDQESSLKGNKALSKTEMESGKELQDKKKISSESDSDFERFVQKHSKIDESSDSDDNYSRLRKRKKTHKKKRSKRKKQKRDKSKEKYLSKKSANIVSEFNEDDSQTEIDSFNGDAGFEVNDSDSSQHASDAKDKTSLAESSIAGEKPKVCQEVDDESQSELEQIIREMNKISNPTDEIIPNRTCPPYALRQKNDKTSTFDNLLSNDDENINKPASPITVQAPHPSSGTNTTHPEKPCLHDSTSAQSTATVDAINAVQSAFQNTESYATLDENVDLIQPHVENPEPTLASDSSTDQIVAFDLPETNSKISVDEREMSPDFSLKIASVCSLANSSAQSENTFSDTKIISAHLSLPASTEEDSDIEIIDDSPKAPIENVIAENSRIEESDDDCKILEDNIPIARSLSSLPLSNDKCSDIDKLQDNVRIDLFPEPSSMDCDMNKQICDSKRSLFEPPIVSPSGAISNLMNNSAILNILDKIDINCIKNILEKSVNYDSSSIQGESPTDQCSSHFGAAQAENLECNNYEVAADDDDSDIMIIDDIETDVKKTNISKELNLKDQRENAINKKPPSTGLSATSINLNISTKTLSDNFEVRKEFNVAHHSVKDGNRPLEDTDASKNLITKLSAESEMIGTLVEVYKAEYDKYKSIKSAGNDVSANLQMLQVKQKQKLENIKSAMRCVLKSQPCLYKDIKLVGGIDCENIKKEESDSVKKELSKHANSNNLDTKSESNTVFKKLSEAGSSKNTHDDQAIFDNVKSESTDETSGLLINPTIVEKTEKLLESSEYPETKLKEKMIDLKNGKCAECGKKAAWACRDCKDVLYCSDQCSMLNWEKGHHATCGR